jgi:hypothetical protein
MKYERGLNFLLKPQGCLIKGSASVKTIAYPQEDLLE